MKTRDKKILKAIKSWAEALGIEDVEYDDFWHAFRYGNSTINFNEEEFFIDSEFFDQLEDGKWYEISKLCGGEE